MIRLLTGTFFDIDGIATQDFETMPTGDITTPNLAQSNGTFNFIGASLNDSMQFLGVTLFTTDQ